MEKGFKAFLKRKDIVISWKRYFIDAMGAMASGLFASLLKCAFPEATLIVVRLLQHSKGPHMISQTLSGIEIEVR